MPNLQAKLGQTQTVHVSEGKTTFLRKQPEHADMANS